MRCRRLGFRLVVAAALAFSAGCGRPSGITPGSGETVDLSRWIPELHDMVIVSGGWVELDLTREAPNGNGWLPDRGRRRSRSRDVRSVRIEPFFMDRFEVTRRDFLEFVESTDYRPHDPARLDRWLAPDSAEILDAPMVHVTFDDASAYARHLGKRLPTTAEWLLAARGESERNYPWGRSFNKNRLNCLETGIGRAWRVGTFESGKSRDGLYDLVGNVWEWTLGGAAEAERQSIVGGSYSRAMEPEVGASLMAWAHREEWSNEIGFRCVRDVTRRIYDHFLELLDSEWRSVRLRVLEDLVRLDPDQAAEALAVVQRRDPDAYVRVEAANRLLALRREDRIEISELIRVLEPPNALEHRLNAASCLTFLAVSLEDSDLRVTPRPLLRILEGMPREGVGRVPRDPMATVRVAGSISLAELYRTLAQLLVRIGEPEILDLLVRHARLASDARFRTAAAESLGYFNFVADIAPGPVAAALVEVVLDDPDASARRAALESLLGFDPREVDAALLRVLAEAEEPELRVAAARQAVWIGSEAAVRALGRVLGAPDIGPKLRIACADSLLRMLGEASAEEGDDAAESEFQRARDAALLGGLDAFAPAMDHPDERIRLDAAELVVEILDDRRIERIAPPERALRAAAIYWLRARARGVRLELWVSGLEETVREGDEAREEIDRWRQLILEDLTRAIEGAGRDERARLAESLTADPAFATFRGPRDRPSAQYVSLRERLGQ